MSEFDDALQMFRDEYTRDKMSYLLKIYYRPDFTAVEFVEYIDRIEKNVTLGGRIYCSTDEKIAFSRLLRGDEFADNVSVFYQ